MSFKRMPGAAALLLALGPRPLLGAEGGGGLFNVNPGLSVWTSLVFVILLTVLWRFAWSPILAALEGRERGIQDALDQSAAQRAEAAELLDEHKRQLADARRQAGEIIAAGRAAGERVRKEVEGAARTEAQGIVEAARREIERERDRALADLRRESVELALAAAAKLMRKRLDAAEDRDLVVDYLDQLIYEGRGAEA